MTRKAGGSDALGLHREDVAVPVLNKRVQRRNEGAGNMKVKCEHCEATGVMYHKVEYTGIVDERPCPWCNFDGVVEPKHNESYTCYCGQPARVQTGWLLGRTEDLDLVICDKCIDEYASETWEVE